jgi:hypothetical protein
MQDTRLALKSEIIVERDSDEDDIVLVDSHSGRMCVCNETGSAVVAVLRNGSTMNGLVDMLITKFAVDDEVATRDVNAFLDLLSAEGMLETLETVD